MKPLFLLSILVTLCASQFPPRPKGINTITVKSQPGVSVSYKKTCICDTSVNAYAGYVHLPASYTGESYDASLFFWYFEALNDPENAPTTIYLAGGPGESSTYSAAADGGPCVVLGDSETTVENPWSYNQHSNVLYVDQPVGAGFSYNNLVRSTQDWLFLGDPTNPIATSVKPFKEYKGAIPPENITFTYGTLPSQNLTETTNSTATAARTLWQFSQVWFSNFPEQRTVDNRINLWGNSYGGLWCTITGAYFFEQNAKVAQGQIQGAINLSLDTVGFTNGFVDALYQFEWYPEYAYNNTYDLQVIPKPVYEAATHNFTKSGGCRDLIERCRSLGQSLDPLNTNTNDLVNTACVEAVLYCFNYVAGPYDGLSNRSDFDIAHLKPDPGPPASNAIGYFNSAKVQDDLGVPVNFTGDSQIITANYFPLTGDPARVAGMGPMETLLNAGVKVVLVYGDRDYRTPWNGAEKLSLAANWTGGSAFRKAGYEFIQTNDTYQGGAVRQHGNFSFSRVFQAGHGAASYQPETVNKIFNRAIANLDVATGTVPTDGANGKAVYTSHGPHSSFNMVREQLPPPPPFQCYVWNINNIGSTCTQEQYDALADGTAVVQDLHVVKPAGGNPGALT